MSFENIYRERPAEVASYICGLMTDRKVLSDGVPSGRHVYTVESQSLAGRIKAVLDALNVQSQWSIVKFNPSNDEFTSEFVIQWSTANNNKVVIKEPSLCKMYLRGFLDATLLPQSSRKSLSDPTDDMIIIRLPNTDSILTVLDAYCTANGINATSLVDEKENTRTLQFLRQTLNDLLLSVYTDVEPLCLADNLLLRSKMVCQVKNLNTNTPGVPSNRFALVDKAVAPSKNRFGDVGYDLTLIGIAKEISPVVKLYETGVVIEPAHGWYAEVVPRSSIIKTGHMLANCAGIIDPTYRGSIKVALIKVDPNAPDLDLSNPDHVKPVQIIFRPFIHHELVKVDLNQLSATDRNDKGFGSSNHLPDLVPVNNNK